MGFEYSISIGGYTYNYGDIIYVKGNGYVSAYAGSGVGITYGDNYRTRFYGVYSATGDIAYPICVGETQDGQSATANYFIKADQIVSGGKPIVTVGNFAAYAYDERIPTYPNTNGWFEAVALDWNGFGAPSNDPIVKYKIYYQETASGDSPGQWSGNNYVGETTSPRYFIGKVNQNAEASGWGGRGYWYRWGIRAVTKSGVESDIIHTAALRKCFSYKQTFDANGGTGAPSEIYKFTNYDLIFPSAPTRTGHAFVGWNASPSAADGYAVGSRANTANAAVTWYAIWKANDYSLTVNPNGGTWNGSTSNQTFTQKFGTTKSVSNPTRVGYNFAGWKLNGYGSFDGQTYTYGAGNGELVAQWNRIVCTVTFDASTNGGSPNSTRNVYYGDTIGTLPVPSKPFYKFIGWFTKAVGGTQISANNVITSNVTFYALYKIDASVKVKYNGNNIPAIVWVKVNGAWKKCVTWIKNNGKWNKSTGAD